MKTKNGNTIIKGVSLMILKNGNRTGWHKFETDAHFTIKLDRRTYEEILVVASGPDKGQYAW